MKRYPLEIKMLQHTLSNGLIVSGSPREGYPNDGLLLTTWEWMVATHLRFQTRAERWSVTTCNGEVVGSNPTIAFG